jgi:hypothetical protein
MPGKVQLNQRARITDSEPLAPGGLFRMPPSRTRARPIYIRALYTSAVVIRALSSQGAASPQDRAAKIVFEAARSAGNVSEVAAVASGRSGTTSAAGSPGPQLFWNRRDAAERVAWIVDHPSQRLVPKREKAVAPSVLIDRAPHRDGLRDRLQS